MGFDDRRRYIGDDGPYVDEVDMSTPGWSCGPRYAEQIAQDRFNARYTFWFLVIAASATVLCAVDTWVI